MKIVDVCEFYSPTGGGVRRYINQKLALAGKFGHELTIIAPGAETRMEAARGGTIAWIKSPHLPFDRNYRMFWNHQQVWRTLDRIAPDLVEGSSPWRGGWLAARWPGKAVKVFFMHADPVAVYPQTFLGGLLGPERVDRLFGFFWRYLNRLNSNYDAAIVTNPALAERFAGFGLENIQIAPFGVERSKFSPSFYDATARREMLATCGLGADASLLIAVGRHHPEKRLRTIIQAVSRAQASHNIEQRGFTRSRGAKNYCNAAAEFCFHFESKIGKGHAEIAQREAHAFRAFLRSNSSLPQTAAKASTTDTPNN